MRQATANDEMKQEAETGDATAAAGSSSLAVTSYNWHHHQQAMAVPVQPAVPGTIMEGHRSGDEVDESIRKLLYKLGGAGPFATLSVPQCVLPSMYEGSPSLMPLPCPAVDTSTSLNESSAQQGSSVLPALELDQSFHFNQVKLDGLESFFGMGTDQSMRWSEVSPLVCPNNIVASTSQGMQQYCLVDEPGNLGMK